jgi:hypothetical protein
MKSIGTAVNELYCGRVKLEFWKLFITGRSAGLGPSMPFWLFNVGYYSLFV